jgi:hypothetical protein
MILPGTHHALPDLRFERPLGTSGVVPRGFFFCPLYGVFREQPGQGDNWVLSNGWSGDEPITLYQKGPA